MTSDRLPPPRTLILDFTMTHPRIGRSHVHPSGQLTNIRRSDGDPEPDGSLKVVVRKKIIHYHQLYLDHPEPISFIPVGVDTSGHIYDDFLRFLFLPAHREELTSGSSGFDFGENIGHEDFHTARFVI